MNLFYIFNYILMNQNFTRLFYNICHKMYNKKNLLINNYLQKIILLNLSNIYQK